MFRKNFYPSFPLRRWCAAPLVLALLAVCLNLRPLAAGDGSETLFTIEDIAGDDHGGGALIYPASEHYQQGDLDLLSFSARPTEDGAWFSVTLANPVRSAEGVTLGMGSSFVPVKRVARHGFFAFNIEVYIDQDGLRGAGRTDTLPGRRVSIAPEFAWERAIIVTPRPRVARNIMRDYWREQAVTAGYGQPLFDQDNGYIYADKIRVNHNRVDFFVSRGELGGMVQPGWAYAVFITGAELMQSSNFLSWRDKNTGLMLRGARPGRPEDQFGLRYGDPEQPVIVDYLSPRAGRQELLLSGQGLRQGWRIMLPGVMADGSVREVIGLEQGLPPPEALQERRLSQERRARQAAARRDLTVDLAKAKARIKQLEQRQMEQRRTTMEGKIAGGAEGRIAAEGGIKGDTLPEKLASLRQVYEQGVINQREYQRIRQRLLSEDI